METRELLAKILQPPPFSQQSLTASGRLADRFAVRPLQNTDKSYPLTAALHLVSRG
ncbi:hypothetical protein AAIO65_15785 [Erwinia amylovora]